MRFSVFLISSIILVPAIAQACPGCIGANEENRNAFLFTTALLTFIPLIIIGVTARWIQLRAKRLQEDAEKLTESFSKQT